MERMSALDAGFFHVESENVPMHVGSVAVFEGPAPTYGDLIRLLLSKLPQVPRYRQRVRTLPLSFGRPVWADDEHFQILYHVRHTAVPGPGGPEELRNLAGRVFGQRLDRAKPLWEVWLVEGLEKGRWAIISKVHHCMVDGVAGTDLMTLIFDVAADAEHPPPREWSPRPAPSALSLVADGLRAAVTEPARQVAGVPAVARNISGFTGLRDFGRGLPGTLRRLTDTPVRSLNGPVGPHRRWAWTEAELAQVKRIRRAVGGSVNDVVLAAVTHGFRDLLTGRGEQVDGRVVRSLVPVSVRAPAERGTLNNKVAGVLVNLPVDEPAPLRRLALVRGQMDEIKRTRQALAAEALTGLAGFAAPTLLALGSRSAFRLPQSLVQAVTTNVPGPRFPLYVLGRPMCQAYPFVPIGNNLRVSVGIFSYLGHLHFGVNADYDTVPDVEVLTEGIRRGFDELLAAAETAAEARAAEV
ncbi:wax ester/triacylglycerol synthase family O-acyltransferase [Spirillospora sp. NPDC048911]|uniref:WS/DGAT/MGAT family O-acyltransferase n=1 Tax=Spirillospora sp. NPDC048911 TaxID=3364527 RepID=UPI0037213AAD